MANASAKLYRMVQSHGFVRNGSAMFRVHGDGIVQILKFGREKTGELCLRVGLLSMYGVLEPEWFSPLGWNLRYDIITIVGQRWSSDVINSHKGKLVDWQLRILEESGIPWLNEMQTQKQLVEGICYLECGSNGSLVWSNGLKLAPYLKIGDITSARRIANTILTQHNDAYQANRKIFATEEEYRKYLEPRLIRDEKLQYVLDLIDRNNGDEILDYLKANYSRNTEYAKFCMKE